METVVTVELPAGVRPLPVVGGQLALDFANSVDDPLGPERFDHLPGYDALLNWAEAFEVLDAPAAQALRSAAAAHPRRATTALRDAHRLRDAVGAAATEVADGSAAGDGWLALRPFVAEALEHAELDGPRPAWPATDLRAPLWPVAEAAYRLLTGPERSRVKRCGGCPWVFVDRSKNGSRRWCSMEDCGTHQKIQRYVERRRARAGRA